MSARLPVTKVQSGFQLGCGRRAGQLAQCGRPPDCIRHPGMGLDVKAQDLGSRRQQLVGRAAAVGLLQPVDQDDKWPGVRASARIAAILGVGRSCDQFLSKQSGSRAGHAELEGMPAILPFGFLITHVFHSFFPSYLTTHAFRLDGRIPADLQLSS
ncbi:hypothetical protein [Cupriavidus sp. CuC1]|uniref:hypothetical protein n=1 Tax=Cupriavidus sp. CuC1 TaxID=3373131 RepID=UPI0037D0D2B2